MSLFNLYSKKRSYKEFKNDFMEEMFRKKYKVYEHLHDNFQTLNQQVQYLQKEAIFVQMWEDLLTSGKTYPAHDRFVQSDKTIPIIWKCRFYYNVLHYIELWKRRRKQPWHDIIYELIPLPRDVVVHVFTFVPLSQKLFIPPNSLIAETKKYDIEKNLRTILC